MADEDETELPLWWVGDRQLRLRLGGSFARVLKRLDAHAVAAMQGTGSCCGHAPGLRAAV